ncbi:hypothetical protein BDZ89DRAFT_1136098 [Hymenopellis radicata]|nr:hypothetical protein BDZ89DRAFT_1136098 [Hymenopellis radicata]
MATREGWSRKYIDPKKAAKSYWPNGMMSPSLKRAREPYRIPNIITGVCLSIFVVGVYTYSIRAVKQDEFEDVDDEARSRIRDRQRANAGNLTVKEESELMEAAIRNVQAKRP